VVQIDEANIPGHPEDIPWAIEALNHVLDGIKTTRAVHICFGNYGGQSIQKGLWQSLLPLLNGLHVNHYVLEFARRGYDELPLLKDVDPKIGIGLSVVDIKDNEVESAELIASRIENAARILGEDRIHYVHPDCGFWMLQRSVADRKMQALAVRRRARSTSTDRIAVAAAAKKCARLSQPRGFSPPMRNHASCTSAVGWSVCGAFPAIRRAAIFRSSLYTSGINRSLASRSPAAMACRSVVTCSTPRLCLHPR
jgi:hypothetical protein